MLDPATILKSANRLAHKLTYDDVFIALMLLREDNPREAEIFEGLVVRLTDHIDMAKWKGNLCLVKEDCLMKRKR